MSLPLSIRQSTLVVCVLGAIGVLAIHAATGSAAPHRVLQPQDPARVVSVDRAADAAAITGAAHVRISRLLARDFAVLAEGARISTSDNAPILPQGIAATVATNGYVAANPSDARYVSMPSGGVWVVPGSNGACIVESHAFVTVCGRLAQVMNGELRTGNAVNEGSVGLSFVFGLAPNGNASVAVESAGGSVESVPVVDNVYEASGSDLVAVRLKTSRGIEVTKPL